MQLQTKELELRMASLKLQDQSHLCERAQVQTQKMTEALTQMQAHKSETDKLLASYNHRFSECQQSIEISNEVSGCCFNVCMAVLLCSSVVLLAGRCRVHLRVKACV